MALYKVITVKGATLSYWKISEIIWDDKSNTTKVTFTPYVSEEKRFEDPNNRFSEFSRSFLLPGYKTVPEAYNIVKTYAEWNDAIDVLSVEQQAIIMNYLAIVSSINIESVTPISSDWAHSDRPFRFTAPLSLLFLSPTWTAFAIYADKKRIPWVSTASDSVTYYLQEIYPEHEQMLSASGITIEEKPE